MDTYADYSMMGQRRAGALYHGDELASQWAWHPQKNTVEKEGFESHIYWAKALGGQYREHFVIEGDWVMLYGWWDNGTYYTVDVTFEQLDGVTISTGGPQHYVQWVIPDQPYVLRVEGTVTEELTGNFIRFGHTQGWWPPALFNGHLCIRQWESWWDDNGGPYQREVDREQYLAKGIGPGFAVFQYYPFYWEGKLRDSWSY